METEMFFGGIKKGSMEFMLNLKVEENPRNQYLFESDFKLLIFM